jgi:hypothetical protein
MTGNIILLSEEKARLARQLGLPLQDHAELIGARATLRSPLHQSDADLRYACSVLLRLGDWRDSQIARHMLLMLDRADLKEPDAPSSVFAGLYLPLVACAVGILVVLRFVEWWLS